ncbi:MAG: hypothetical protein GAK43_01518 [Stenotrophomonas maltophilia]|nr:MAG: hypothetical protein GAK43_01518 [Stenotrophomonas maltophilia]
MRPLLLALALIPFACAQAHDDDDHDHGTLGKHEHGVAQMNVAVDGNSLELELDSPAMNFFGFEHPASSAADKATVAAAQAQLQKPLDLFLTPAAAKCSEAEAKVESPLFASAAPAASETHAGHQHADVDGHFRLTCENPEALTQVDFAPLFKRFPGTQKVQVQLIGPKGQQGAELNASNSVLAF